MNNRKIIFINNAKNNVFSMFSDYVHKMVDPSTYQCSLCKLTHSNFEMKQEWKSFIERIDGEKSFLYKDDFEKQYKEHSNFTAPAVFLEENGKLHELLSSGELNNYQSLSQLQQAFSTKLNNS